MKISVIQTKRRFAYDHSASGDYDIDMCRHCSMLEMNEGFEMVESAAGQGARLIVTVEGFNESVSPRDPRLDFRDYLEPLDGPLVGRFSAIARKYGTHIVAGLYTLREGKAYNSGVLFGPDGGIIGIYDKVHMPYDDAQYFTSGDSYPVFKTDFGNLGILICWDMQFPEAVREIALGGADLLACPTMGWEPIYGYCRAYENGISLAIAMYVPHGRPLWDDCDPSCIVDNTGRIVAAAARDGAQVVIADLDVRKEPPAQYGADDYTGMQSMRQIRMAQRRPDTYRLVASSRPPVLDRYRQKQ